MDENRYDNVDDDSVYSPYPLDKPSWMPLWMWQDVHHRQRNQYSAEQSYSAQSNEQNAYSEYAFYGDDIEDIETAEENEDDLKGDSWIELNELATHDFDTEWEDDERWDEVSEMKTWEGTSIRRKCLHLWKHRLCLCQFLGWMDTNKYQCIYHHRSVHAMPSSLQQKVNHVRGHVSDTKRAPNVMFHQHYRHRIARAAPRTITRGRRRNRQVMNINHLPIVWHNHAMKHNVIDRPVKHRRTDVVDQSVQHHYHHVIDQTVQHHVHDIVHHPVQEDIHHIIHHPIRQDVYHTVEHYTDNVNHPQFVEEHVAGQGPQILRTLHRRGHGRGRNVVEHHFERVPEGAVFLKKSSQCVTL